MIVKILGILDILAGAIFWFFGVFKIEIIGGILLIIGLFLIVKGVVFLTGLSFASGLDVISGVIIISSSSIALPLVVIIITSLFLMQKGVFSLVS